MASILEAVLRPGTLPVSCAFVGGGREPLVVFAKEEAEVEEDKGSEDDGQGSVIEEAELQIKDCARRLHS